MEADVQRERMEGAIQQMSNKIGYSIEHHDGTAYPRMITIIHEESEPTVMISVFNGASSESIELNREELTQLALYLGIIKIGL